MTAMTIVSGLITVLCATVFIYPYVLYPLSLRPLPSRPVAYGDPESDGTDFALFFCAYNEAKVMPEKLENLRELKARYPKLQIFGYDDASSDGTLQMMQAEPDLLTAVVGAGRTGKAHGMKRMVAGSDARFLVFTDANVILDIESIAQFARYYADERVGGVCGTLRYQTSKEATATEATGGLYWKLEEWSKGVESRSGNVMGADGSIFSVRHELYPDFPDTVQDDFTVSMSVVFAGRRLVKAPHVIAYERLVSDKADEAQRKMRIAARAYHTHQTLRLLIGRMSAVDKYKYSAHKLLRWMGAIPGAIGAAAAVVCLVSLGEPGLIVLAVLGAVCVLGRMVAPLLTGFVWDLLVAVVATFRGVLRARRGETVAVWTPPATR